MCSKSILKPYRQTRLSAIHITFWDSETAPPNASKFLEQPPGTFKIVRAGLTSAVAEACKRDLTSLVA